MVTPTLAVDLPLCSQILEDVRYIASRATGSLYLVIRIEVRYVYIWRIVTRYNDLFERGHYCFASELAIGQTQWPNNHIRYCKVAYRCCIAIYRTIQYI